ncbi:MAG: gliding motility-associated C-terminal domain-containing protein [Saprospiraceae bacterium]|nr:gliding motility-associated C-terminal domain-containing protein [Saprospiraceae bacterium]
MQLMIGYRVAINGSLTSNVTLNDAYSNAFNWIVAVATAPQNGTVTISTNGEFTYKPNNGYKGADKFTYKLAYADCPDIFKTAEVVLDVNNDNVDDCNIPNIITPNDDDENDVLIIPCADSYPESELTVYNKWGSVVYNERNYKNKWKRTYNGDLLPAGTYYYTYKLKPSDSKCKVGYVTIVRD